MILLFFVNFKWFVYTIIFLSQRVAWENKLVTPLEFLKVNKILTPLV